MGFVSLLYIASLRILRYKFMVFREQGAGSREEVSRKWEEVKNNVYLMSPRNAIAVINSLKYFRTG